MSRPINHGHAEDHYPNKERVSETLWITVVDSCFRLGGPCGFMEAAIQLWS